MNTIDGVMFKNMILNGAENLKNRAEYVDSLNVFPVPDGDTGTNMNLSIASGADEVRELNESHVGTLGQHFSKGLLMGARGNSGVILSQLFRGFSKSIESKDVLNVQDFKEALDKGVKNAYKAVMKPVEGTILTVAKDSSIAANEFSGDSLVELMETVIKAAKTSLNHTPELLPVLKEVGVVDSGGQGLVYVYEGFLSALKGEVVEQKESVDTNTFVNDTHDFDPNMSAEDIEFGFCTEFMVRFEPGKKAFDEETFRADMSQFGDSLLVINDDEIVKVHVHTETPGEAMTYGATYGELIKMKIENMREQFREIQKKKQTESKAKKTGTAIITVCAGDGVQSLFESMGATHVINGGQTMNPSTEDILNIVKDDHIDSVIILPNNKNIILAAEQAVELFDVPAVVVPTCTISEGLATLVYYSPDVSIEDNRAAMDTARLHVKSGQVTFAVRDTSIDGIEIKNGQHMGIENGKIKSSNDNREETLKGLIESMIDEDSEIITVLIGEDGDHEELDHVIEYIESVNDEVEFEVHEGNQPVYSYLISVE